MKPVKSSLKRSIAMVVVSCFFLFQCQKECELVETRAIAGGGRTEVFNCWENNKKMVREFRYWGGDTLQSLIVWVEGDSVKKAESFYKNGQIEAKWDILNGEEDGEITCWHPNGNLKRELVVQAGLPHGMLVEYNEKGDTVFSGDFVHGKKQGAHKYWNEAGDLVEHKVYETGELIRTVKAHSER